MRSAEARDAVVARVNAAFAQHRSFDDWPVVTKWDVSFPVNITVPPEYRQAEYVKALYGLCAEGIPVGRLKDEPVLVGTREPA